MFFRNEFSTKKKIARHFQVFSLSSLFDDDQHENKLEEQGANLVSFSLICFFLLYISIFIVQCCLGAVEFRFHLAFLLQTYTNLENKNLEFFGRSSPFSRLRFVSIETMRSRLGPIQAEQSGGTFSQGVSVAQIDLLIEEKTNNLIRTDRPE